MGGGKVLILGRFGSLKLLNIIPLLRINLGLHLSLRQCTLLIEAKATVILSSIYLFTCLCRRFPAIISSRRSIMMADSSHGSQSAGGLHHRHHHHHDNSTNHLMIEQRHEAEIAAHLSKDDARDIAALGKEQVFIRKFSFWAVLAIAVCTSGTVCPKSHKI